MSTPHVSPHSEEWLERLGLTTDDIPRFYKEDSAPWKSDSAHAAEAWDLFTARVVIGIRRTHRRYRDEDADSSASRVLGDWTRLLREKLTREAPNNTRGQTEGGYILAKMRLDFICWLARLSDAEMSEHGGRLLSEMLQSTTEENQHSDVYNPDAEPLIRSGGVYTARLVEAWGSDDTRALDFYRVGIVDRALIERCIADGVEPDFALSVVA